MPIIGIFKAFLLGLSVGFTGALVPGPMLFATIGGFSEKKWLAGPQVVLGHMIVEVVLYVLILIGVASLVDSGTIFIIFLIGFTLSLRASYLKKRQKCGFFCTYFPRFIRLKINFRP